MRVWREAHAPNPKARWSDPITSHLAAADVAPRVRRHRRLVLLAHADHPGGLTDFQLAELVGLAQTSCGVRRKSLERSGHIVATSERRLSPSGSPSIVWRISPAGLELAAWVRRLEQERAA